MRFFRLGCWLLPAELTQAVAAAGRLAMAECSRMASFPCLGVSRLSAGENGLCASHHAASQPGCQSHGFKCKHFLSLSWHHASYRPFGECKSHGPTLSWCGRELTSQRYGRRDVSTSWRPLCSTLSQSVSRSPHCSLCDPDVRVGGVAGLGRYHLSGFSSLWILAPSLSFKYWHSLRFWIPVVRVLLGH